MAQKFSGDHSSQSYNAVYEQDARARAVDAYMWSHLDTTFTNSYHAALEKIFHNSIAAGLPDISCSPLQAKFLKTQIRIARAKHILEVGTLGGYSAAWMATAATDVHVTTIEIDPEFATLAAKNVQEAGLASQITILKGAGLEILPSLLSEVQNETRPPFDFVFIDANKQDNLAYFEYALSMTTAAAAIVVDNVVRNGKVVSAEEAAKDDRVFGTRKLIEAIGKNKNVDATVIQTVGEKNYDGFLIAVKQP